MTTSNTVWKKSKLLRNHKEKKPIELAIDVSLNFNKNTKFSLKNWFGFSPAHLRLKMFDSLKGIVLVHEIFQIQDVYPI